MTPTLHPQGGRHALFDAWSHQCSRTQKQRRGVTGAVQEMALVGTAPRIAGIVDFPEGIGTAIEHAAPHRVAERGRPRTRHTDHCAASAGKRHRSRQRVDAMQRNRRRRTDRRYGDHMHVAQVHGLIARRQAQPAESVAPRALPRTSRQRQRARLPSDREAGRVLSHRIDQFRWELDWRS